MIYVLGVHHQEEQFPHLCNIRSKVDALKDVVRRFVDEHRVELIAEEWCDDYQNPLRPTSHCKEIANELRCEYLACDPLEVDWKRLGIKRRLRIAEELGKSFCHIMSFEDCAKAKIADEEKNTLMICGHDHTESFTALMQPVGYEAQNLGRVTAKLPQQSS